MKIAHLSAEVAPFSKAGGLADVVGSLPVAQAQLGHEVSVWSPLHRAVRRELSRRGGITTTPLGEPFEITLAGVTYPVAVLRAFLPGSHVPVHFVESDRFFDRTHVYALAPDGRDDGLLRFSFFVHAALEAMRRFALVPDVLDAHDWHSALGAILLAWDRPNYPHFANTVTVLTVHNLAYQGTFDPTLFPQLGLSESRRAAMVWEGGLNLLRAGLLTAVSLTTVSPTFAWEITTPEGGFRLDPVLRQRAADLTGIVNGVDSETWNPAADPLLPARYSADDPSGKAENRRALLETAEMDSSDAGPLFGMVGRLTAQKGYELLLPVLDELISQGNRFVLLGSGESHIEERLRALSQRAPGRFWACIGFDDALAHLIEAGADAFLMPSIFEPCGLNQLYSLAYGTPPVVRRVGGLADTVIGYDGSNPGTATGFSFDRADPLALREAVRWAARCFRDKPLWRHLVRNGMSQDFSWRRSAERYVEAYRQAARKAQAHWETTPGASSPT
jgi:starch synthase